MLVRIQKGSDTLRKFGSFLDKVNINLPSLYPWAQLCLMLWDPMDCSLPGFSDDGISQARILEWVAFPTPEDLPNPGTEPSSLACPVKTDSLPLGLPGKPFRFIAGVFLIA